MKDAHRGEVRRMCGAMLTWRGPAVVLLILPWMIGWSNELVSPHDALCHVKQTVTVCGKVVSASHVKTQPHQPTYLNLDEPYPNEVFTGIVLGGDRGNFSYAPESLLNRNICVTGKVRCFQKKAIVVIRQPSQITEYDSER